MKRACRRHTYNVGCWSMCCHLLLLCNFRFKYGTMCHIRFALWAKRNKKLKRIGRLESKVNFCICKRFCFFCRSFYGKCPAFVLIEHSLWCSFLCMHTILTARARFNFFFLPQLAAIIAIALVSVLFSIRSHHRCTLLDSAGRVRCASACV